MRFKNGFRLGAMALAAALFLGGASTARADFEVQFSYGTGVITIDDTTHSASATGGASLAGATINYDYKGTGTLQILNLTVDPNGSTDGNSGGFNISASVSKTNSPGSPTASSLSTSGLAIMNQTGVSGNSTLTIMTGSTGFTQPVGTGVVLNSTASVSADATNSGTATLVFNSYLNNDNSQFGTGGTGIATPTITIGPLNPGASGSGNTSMAGTATNPYSLVQIGQYTLANGDDFFDGSSGSGVTVPAPAGLVLLLSGTPFLAFGAWRRSRKQAKSKA